MKRRGLAALAALVGLSSVAPAQSPAPSSLAAAVVDPAALAAARRLVAATDVQAQMRALLPQIGDAAMAQARATFKTGQVPEGLNARLEAVMRRGLASFADIYTPDLFDRMARAYAAHLSARELSRVADMMADPAMRRFRAQSPAIMRDVMPAMMAAMAPKQAAFQKAIMQTIADWVRDHPDDKAQLAKPAAS